MVSDKERNRTLHNFDHKLSTRLDNPKYDVIVVIAQRLHTRDLTGHLLDGPDGKRWTHLCIPMEAPERKTFAFPISMKEFTREEGALLNPMREGAAELEEHRARLGLYGYAAQFQQNPLPPGGGIFKTSYFRLWPRLDRNGNEQFEELPKFDRIAQSWDTALKANETNSFTVCTTWGVCDFGYFLIHVLRKHLEFPEMMHAMRELAGEYKPDAILVEDKASGQSAIQELRRTTLPVIAIHVDADKVARARAAAPTAEAGKIWIMRNALWSRAYIDELTHFPKVEFSDQVDSTTHFINWARQSGFGSKAYHAETEEDIQYKIERGFICGYPGCRKPIAECVYGVYWQSRGLNFCSYLHSF